MRLDKIVPNAHDPLDTHENENAPSCIYLV
jgi:hypothetical protein